MQALETQVSMKCSGNAVFRLRALAECCVLLSVFALKKGRLCTTGGLFYARLSRFGAWLTNVVFEHLIVVMQLFKNNYSTYLSP
jgi:hypothetical protein